MAHVPDRPICHATRKDGQACGSQVLCDGTYCYVHAPDRQQQRAEARRRGGANRANAVRLRALMPPRLIPAFDKLEQALADVLDGSLTPQQATAAAALARAMVAVLTAGELEERLRALEGRASA